MADKNTIKNWFKTGLKPTQVQFWATWDSFWHKDEKIPITAIDNIETILAEKADAEALAYLQGLVVSSGTKENIANKISAISGNSEVEYPNEKAVVDYVTGYVDSKSISLLRNQFVWTGGSQTLTLSDNYSAVYSVEVRGISLKDTQYTLVAPNQITINDTLGTNDYIVVLFGNAQTGLQPYYSKSEVDSKLSTVSGGNVVTSDLPKLHSTEKKLKFVMYWPRLSPYMDWWKELEAGQFTWNDVDTDLDRIKYDLGANAVRVFVYYDNQFRQTGTLGWTDGLGNHNPIRLAQLKQFIELADSYGLDVLVTMYQLLPALTTTDNWDFLENDIAHYMSFHSWLLNGIKNYRNVVCYNLMNEPDGYGVFGDAVLGSRVLNFLNKLRNLGKTVAPNLKCIVNATTHDNSFRRFPNTPAEANSIYDLTDVLAHNSFRWADTGDWAGTNFQTQLAYLNAKNVLNKPIAMMECGFPSNYAQQLVQGYQRFDESGTLIEGIADSTEESIVPQGNVFDRPIGRIGGLAHTLSNQAKSVGEAIAMAERYDLDGLGVWSAYDHMHPTAPYVYRDPFGLIDKTGNTISEAGKMFKYALTEKYPYNLKHKLSLSSGTVGGDARINGLGGWNSIDVTKNTPNGVYLGVGGSYWDSGALAVSFPVKIALNFTIRTAYTHQEPMIISLLTNGKQLDFRYKVYGVNSWQRLEATSADIDRGWASNSPVLSVGDHSLVIDFSTIDLSPTIQIDGVLLDYSTSGIEPFALWMLADGFRIVVRNNSDSPMDLKEMFAKGIAEGEAIPMNREFAKPIVRKELKPRVL